MSAAFGTSLSFFQVNVRDEANVRNEVGSGGGFVLEIRSSRARKASTQNGTMAFFAFSASSNLRSRGRSFSLSFSFVTFTSVSYTHLTLPTICSV